MSTSPTRYNDTNPTTPLSPFPSTPHRLSYIENPNINNPYDNPLAEHVSPTKALVTTRLNHEIATLTSWLEGLFAPDPIPAHFLKWRDEVFAAAASGQTGFDGSLVGGFFDHGITSMTPGRATGGGVGVGGQSDRMTAGPGATNGNDVLEALNALKQMNLSADHLASLIHEARGEELRSLEETQRVVQQQRDNGVRARLLLDEVYTRLSPEAVDALGSLSEAAVMLGLDLSHGSGDAAGNTESRSLAAVFLHGVLEQTGRKLVLDEQIREMGHLQSHIESRAVDDQSSKGGSDLIEEKGDDHHDEQSNAKTAQFNRDTKQINLKIMEYHDRVTGLQRQLASLRSRSNISLGDVLITRARVEERRTRVKALQERFAAFNGLPPDLEDSRNEVRRAIAELDSLKKRREGLFERMGTG